MDTNDKKWLEQRIFDFMVVIDNCLGSTTYANDRYIYMNDLVTASRWLIKLYKGESVMNICKEIISDKTDKEFGDYWRQGLWGENEAIALATLRDQIRNRFNLNEN